MLRLEDLSPIDYQPHYRAGVDIALVSIEVHVQAFSPTNRFTDKAAHASLASAERILHFYPTSTEALDVIFGATLGSNRHGGAMREPSSRVVFRHLSYPMF